MGDANYTSTTVPSDRPPLRPDVGNRRLSDLRETAGATFGRYDVSVEGESPEMVWEDDLGELGDHDEL